uniref:Peptidyl-prolyl cis-trans isomerase E n=1 Tax=Rhizophora mucronata TaxID=61149 RepID=A0A2P2L3S1_RHIMU
MLRMLKKNKIQLQHKDCYAECCLWWLRIVLFQNLCFSHCHWIVLDLCYIFLFPLFFLCHFLSMQLLCSLHCSLVLCLNSLHFLFLLLPLKPGVSIRPDRLCSPTLFTTLDALGEGVIDSEDAAVELGAVHVVHGGGSVFSLEESDESEGTVLLGGLIQRRLHVLDVPERYKGRVECGLVYLLRQSSNVQCVLLHLKVLLRRHRRKPGTRTLFFFCAKSLPRFVLG